MHSIKISSTFGTLQASAALLTGANVLCGVIGASQGLLVLRMLGPDLFGAAAVLVALGAVATNLVDVRLTDLLSRLDHDRQASDTANPGYRAKVLRFGLTLSAGGALLIAIVSGLAMWAAARTLTSVEVSPSVFWLVAAAQGIGYVASFFIFIQRFVAPAAPMAMIQVASALINAVAMLSAVAASRTVGGYAAGLVASAVGIALLNATFALFVFRRSGVTLLGRSQASGPAIDRATALRFITAGNVLGYVKLLHRSADVLLVSFFCSDAMTGLYKVARSMADALYTVSEATNRIYQPRLLQLLQSEDYAQYASVARSMLGLGAGVTLVAVIGELLLVPRVAPSLGITDPSTLTATAIALSLSFFFAGGVQTWIWPAFIFFDRVGRCTLWGVAAVVTGQYVLGPVLFHAVGDGSPVWLCIGYLSYYPLLLFPLWRELQRGKVAFTLRPQVATA